MNKNRTNSRSRHSLRVLCWNINHARDKYEGAKVDIPEIKELFDNHDLVALQETKGVVNIRDFCCVNSNRKKTNSAEECSSVSIKALNPESRRSM